MSDSCLGPTRSGSIASLACDELSIFFTRRDRPTDSRMSAEQLCLGDDFVCDDCRKLWKLIVKKGRESLEIGERVV